MLRQKNIKKILLTGVIVTMVSSCNFFKNDEDTFDMGYSNIVSSFDSDGKKDAQMATVAYSKGNFEEAEKHINNALKKDPNQTQALMVGALNSESMGRLNRARQYYEDLIVVGGDEMSVLGSDNGQPQKVTEIAKKRLRTISLNQSEFLIEDKDGTKSFNISGEAAARQGRSAMEEALFAREAKKVYESKAIHEANVKAVEVLFNDGEKNIISRFLILKELAEKDMITKEEFVNARKTNIGGLLPLTNFPPAAGVDEPVPSPDLVLDRIDALKTAVEDRAITPREFSAERNLIVDAVLPTNPRSKLKNKAPSREILEAAKDLRKLEVIYDLGLITEAEKTNEKNAIERNVKTASGYKSSPTPAQKQITKATPPKPLVTIAKTEATTPTIAPAAVAPAIDSSKTVVEKAPEFIEKKVEIKGTMREFPGNPEVSSPF